MKFLVIGGNGFIGSHLVDKLLENGWDVTVLDLQERRYDSIPSKVRFIKGDLGQSFLVREALLDVDIVFHLAWTTIHEVSNQDPATDLLTNLIPSIRLLEACSQAEIKRFIFVSSGGTVYGQTQTWPIPETHPKNPVNAYGVSKLALEKYLHLFKHLHNLDYVILRPSVPYGPRQNPLGRQGAVAVFLYRVAQGMPITIWGDGTITRDYFFIADLVDALVTSAEYGLSDYFIFNIGGAKGVSLNELLEAVEDIVGKKAIVKYDSARKFDAPHIILDTELARQVLQWQPKVPLTQGLAKTWAWMSSTIQ